MPFQDMSRDTQIESQNWKFQPGHIRPSFLLVYKLMSPNDSRHARGVWNKQKDQTIERRCWIGWMTLHETDSLRKRHMCCVFVVWCVVCDMRFSFFWNPPTSMSYPIYPLVCCTKSPYSYRRAAMLDWHTLVPRISRYPVVSCWVCPPFLLYSSMYGETP